MTASTVSRVVSVVALVAVGFGLGAFHSTTPVAAQAGGQVFELRTYTAPDGKLPLLQKRFRDHTIRIFEKHGMKSVGYWVPQDAPARDNTLIYVILHASRDAAKASWASFAADPEWKKVAAESQVDGPIVSKVVSVYMDATDYSPIR
jgi:NIPSNAP